MMQQSLIPSASVAAMAAGFALLFIAPVVFLIVLGVRRRLSGAPLALGFASFFVSQVVLRIPLLGVLGTLPAFAAFAADSPYLYALLVGGLSAGLFEETARLGGALILKKRRAYRDAVSFGLGHGLCEVMLLVGFNYINLIVLSLMANTNAAALSALLGAETYEVLIAQLQSVTPVLVLWAVVERVSAVLLHMFNTVLVFRAVREKKAVFYFAALALHTVFNFGATLLAPVSVAVCELVLLAAGLACGWGVLKARAWFEAPSERTYA